MCLLVALHRVHPDSPLVVAANRDELLAREATSMTVLQERRPRILGGRDHAAGGTWLAINEGGVVGGLTNRPLAARDPALRSRGEWPLFLARHDSAAVAASAFADSFSPHDYNPGWVLVGDGDDLRYLDMTGGETAAVELEPGIHILENRPLEGPSAKVDLVRRELEGIEASRGAELIERLGALLASHAVPEERATEERSDPAPSRPAAARAACVHLGRYGTRSSTIVLTRPEAPPRVWSADGPPCTAPLVELTGLWSVAGVREVGAGG